MSDMIVYDVAAKILMQRDNAGNMLVGVVAEGDDVTWTLAEQGDPFWAAWFDKLDEARREREEWGNSPHNPRSPTFEEHDPEDATRDACEDYERTSDGR